MASDSPVTPMMPHMVTQATWAPAARSAPGRPRRPRRAGPRPRRPGPPTRASTMTRTNGSVPLGRSRTRPSWPSSASAFTTASHTSALSARRSGCGIGTLTRRWGTRSTSPAERSASERPARSTRSASAIPVRMPSPVVERDRKMMWPDCSPPEAQPVGVERGQDVAVPDVGLAHGDAAGLHGQAEAEVGHDGDGHRVAGELPPLGQIEREQRQQHVAVDDASRRGRPR